MKIILLNTSEERGGAAIACKRLMNALQKCHIDVRLIVRDKQTENSNVISINNRKVTFFINYLRFYWERFVLWTAKKFEKKDLFKISIANVGNNLSRNEMVCNSDIIHIHWINQGFLSLKNIKQISYLGKPIVWTMHDMWPCTGICHHARECNNYQERCGNCFFIDNGKKIKDISYKIYGKKEKLYNSNFTFVTCSQWLKEKAARSSLLKYCNVIHIPNPIDVKKFFPKDKSLSRQKLSLNDKNEILVLFGSAKITDKRKGIDYMISSCDELIKLYPELVNKITIVVFGQNSSLINSIPFSVYSMDYIDNDEDMINLYNAVNIFIIPSLEENLPNTIMEAMACGIPCVGFDVGGIPEMIDHKLNGYVAEYKNAQDLAKGIYWVLNESNYSQLSLNASQKVKDCYSEEVVAEQYITLYDSLLSNNNKHNSYK